MRCTVCAFVLYENPACAAAGMVVDDAGRILLVRRAIEPWRGHWALPAGYQEVDEPAHGRARGRQESGIEVRRRAPRLLYIPANPVKAANLAVTAAGRSAACAGSRLHSGRLGLIPRPSTDMGIENGPRTLHWLARRAIVVKRGTVRGILHAEHDARRRTLPRSRGRHRKHEAVERATEAIRKTFTAGVGMSASSAGSSIRPRSAADAPRRERGRRRTARGLKLAKVYDTVEATSSTIASTTPRPGRAAALLPRLRRGRPHGTRGREQAD
jgi:hypothetical protein